MDYRKLQDLYNRRERDFLLLNTPREWETHLRSLGVRRHEYPTSDFVLWSDALTDWISFPEELAERVLVLGLIP